MWLAPEYRFHIPPEPHPLPRFSSEEIVAGGQFGGGGLFGGGGPPPVSKVTGRKWIVPYWFLLLLTAVLPAWTIVDAVRRRRRTKAGFCEGCGYDLRASSDRCPECGRAVNSRKSVSVP
jgi:hypothetical protein